MNVKHQKRKGKVKQLEYNLQAYCTSRVLKALNSMQSFAKTFLSDMGQDGKVVYFK